MENAIIEKLLKSYKVNPDLNTINAVRKIINLGFDYNWLRNVCIIQDFDKYYKEDIPVMEIYGDLSIKYKDLSINSIRKIVRDRQLYEI